MPGSEKNLSPPTMDRISLKKEIEEGGHSTIMEIFTSTKLNQDKGSVPPDPAGPH